MKTLESTGSSSTWNSASVEAMPSVFQIGRLRMGRDYCLLSACKGHMGMELSTVDTPLLLDYTPWPPQLRDEQVGLKHILIDLQGRGRGQLPPSAAP